MTEENRTKLPRSASTGAPSSTFRQGMIMKAICFNASMDIEKTSIWFRLGYWLWGMDVWVDNVPVLKVIIAINIINLILMWGLK